MRLHYVEVAEPDMHDPSSDFRRLQQALSEQWGLAETTADLVTLAHLQKDAARREDGKSPRRCARIATSWL